MKTRPTRRRLATVLSLAALISAPQPCRSSAP